MTRLTLKVSAGLGALLLPMLPPAAAAAGDPHAWLDRMAYAVEFLNYEGTLVHTHGVHVSVLRIVHRVEGGVVSERIWSLDGAGREIIRDDREITSILPDQQMVMVEPRADAVRESGSPLRQRVLPYAGLDSAHYRISLEGPGRAAGRRAQKVAIVPGDEWRYGYRLWLDHATAMPLKVQVCDTQGGIIEQLLFASIDLPGHIDKERVRSGTTTESFTWRRSHSAPDAPDPAIGAASWRARELPPGFELMAAYTKLSAGETPQTIEHLVYSDGLASVSVFVEAEGAPEVPPENGAYRIGAANAFKLHRKGHLVTAVGEVPGATVEMIARSVRSASGEAQR